MKIVTRLRRHLSPLAGDTVSTLNLPPVRIGLLTKLNLLIVGLIFLTAVAVSVFHFTQQWRDDKQQLRNRGATMLGAMAQLAEYGLTAKDKAYLEQILDSVSNDPNVAYADVFDSKREVLVERRFGPGFAREQPPPLRALQPPPAHGQVAEYEVMIGSKRYIELVAIVAKARLTAGASAGEISRPAGPDGLALDPPTGYLRLGMTQEVQRRLFREQMVGAIAVVLALLVVAILATLLLTRRLVAPMHRLMRAARAVGSGRLDVYVPASSSDELGLLTHTFNHMTQKLGESQSEVANYQRTLEDKVAQRLISAVRESDTVARLGGDEFVVVLPGLDPDQAAYEVMAVLTRVRESFIAPFRLSDQMPTLTCSIGVAMYPIDAADGGNLIKQADTAMYAAKEAGRNAYRFYTADMNARVQLRLQLETDMRRGLMDDEFFLVYQPQIEMKTGRACGVEALLRWRDPGRGVISPAEFIPIAEESGMIQALGARVLRDACRQVMQWHRLDMPLRLSVNLSVQQLQHDSWLGIVEEALSASGLAPAHLDLEITESVIITHPEKAVATLMKLKQMGVSITIDDFGTGYSSLSYLARLPIQGVKIDQRFVHGLEKNRNDEAITQAIIALSHSLGLRCIAEGVETAAQFNFLRSHGCEEAQGYLIARPLPEAQLRSWWRTQEERRHGRDRQADLWQREADD